VAELSPARVAGLVLVGSAITPANDILLEVRDALKPLPDPLPLDFVREFQASALHRPVPDDFFNMIVAESMKAPLRVWQEAFDGLLAFNDAEQLQHIVAPSLILWGDHDALFPGEDGQAALTESIPGSQLIVYEDTGHSPNWEQPERVAADLESFMRRA
jgi:pimeloyl-ACP methyl ester carboxylesterase